MGAASSTGITPGSELTIAVTGPTGEIGKPFVRALEATPEVGRVLAMARRPFDPRELGWTKTEYREGDILDRAAVDDLVADADVVVHLAFIVVKATASSYDINIEGSRNVFGATVAAGVPRLVYTSSVAAYGYHDHSGPLTEEMPTRGTEQHAYSHQKAEVERVLDEALADAATDAYVFRPCIVAGPEAPALLDQLPYLRLEDKVPVAALRLIGRLPAVKPVLPDHGVPFQLVHHDDVAAALVAGVLGRGQPGVYNLAGSGEVRWSDVAKELDWYAFRIPRGAIDVTANVVGRIPQLAVEAGWLEALRVPMLMDCTRARQQLGWRPAYDGRQTLHELVAAHS
ncbi:MAG TPA: NAD-dependent epimerase/dehydratase family protein [Solirubrobacterales bacterium]|nr:NAD-dependent epimerase/dehydratase family protein [Solirubrobacterales bacterium]